MSDKKKCFSVRCHADVYFEVTREDVSKESDSMLARYPNPEYTCLEHLYSSVTYLTAHKGVTVRVKRVWQTVAGELVTNG